MTDPRSPRMTRAAAALIGAGATLVGVLVRDLDTLLAAQFTAGGTWGCILMASFPAALERGRTGPSSVK